MHDISLYKSLYNDCSRDIFSRGLSFFSVTGSMSKLILITVHMHVIGCDLTCNVSFKVLYACVTSLINKFHPISCKMGYLCL